MPGFHIGQVVGHAQDQAVATQPLQISQGDLAETVVAYAFGPWHLDGCLLQTVAAAIEVNLETVALEVDQRRCAGPVQIRDPYLFGIELGIREGKSAHDQAFAETSVAQVRPAFDFIEADTAQLGAVAAQHIAEEHQFTAHIAEQRQVAVRLMGYVHAQGEPFLAKVGVQPNALGPIMASECRPSPARSASCAAGCRNSVGKRLKSMKVDQLRSGFSV